MNKIPDDNMTRFQQARILVSNFYEICKERKIKCRINPKNNLYEVEIYE